MSIEENNSNNNNGKFSKLVTEEYVLYVGLIITAWLVVTILSAIHGKYDLVDMPSGVVTVIGLLSGAKAASSIFGNNNGNKS